MIIKFFLMPVLIFAFSFFNYCHAQFLEVFAIGQQMSGDKTTASEIKLEIAENTVAGVGAGLNIAKFNLNIDLLFGSTQVTVDANTIDTKLSLFDANLDYALIGASLTPIITAGIGSVTFSDSFVKIEKLNETDFSYNIGVGVKWIVSKHYLLKTIYRATWTKIKETDDPILFKGISLNLGYVF